MTRNLAIIGLGYWGPNLVRAFARVPGVRVAGLADLDALRLKRMAAQVPGARAVRDYRALLRDPAGYSGCWLRCRNRSPVIPV